ncbi:response regulator transcription factor [Paenibacillus sp.]|jgi:DNA-binding response OmpR family regulator|uniref:response regulator transcription factor n=1 Tax=Paenibacillus sp. TaxID=58172 RepID=UPI002835A688|nr:response regulator transcription factor [Paenibacillus sp.]MDR0268607.1 response regulator transcription factor [Paenibacillus sp.]
MNRITILIADDEPEIAVLIALHLEKEGYHCIKVHNGQDAIQAVHTQPIDLAILDIMMPKFDGYEVTRQIREQYYMPIIFLSAKASDLDKIEGLVRGADDYITKPFNPMELVARVNAHMRRTMQLTQMSATSKPIIEVAGLIIDPEQRSVNLYGKIVDLTPKEFEILYLMARHPKKVFSTENIFEQVWGEEYFEGGNTVMVHIRTLRKKLGDDKDKFIKTVWGVGYTLHA